jgi:hypothetical protein
MPERWTPEGLDAFLTLMRKHGVRKFSTALDESPLEVEFERQAVAPMADSRPDFPKPDLKKLLDEEGGGICACGHELLQHGEAGCYAGCEAEACAPTTAPTP